jgi:hypothetical protein
MTPYFGIWYAFEICSAHDLCPVEYPFAVYYHVTYVFRGFHFVVGFYGFVCHIIHPIIQYNLEFLVTDVIELLMTFNLFKLFFWELF